MPRYFFDFCQGPDRCADAEGAEFANVEQAYLEAFRAAQDMWSELLRQRRDPRRCVFEICNERRELLFVLPFEEVVESCYDRKYEPIRHSIDRAAHALAYSRRLAGQFKDELHAVHKTLQESRALLRTKI